jgi:hypothetical protein
MSKFVPRSPRPPSALTEAEQRAFAFAEEVHGLGACPSSGGIFGTNLIPFEG